jgi:expansin (peptidoglycan-binding protein)
MVHRWPVFVVGSLLVIACSSTDDGSIEPRTTQDLDAGETGDGSTPVTTSDASAATDASKDAAPVDAGPTYTGEATYYAADGTGSCGFPASPNDLMVAAMNKAQYAKSLCGQCVSVVGPKGTVKVRIVDLCPGCAKGDLDLSEQAFAKIAALSAGRVKISWTFVPC